MQSKKKISSQEFFVYCISTANNALRYCFITRATERQQEIILDLTKLLATINDFKQQAQTAGNEKTANLLLAAQSFLGGIRAELEMWIALKQDRPNDAWNHLIEAQHLAENAIRAEPSLELSSVINRLDEIEKTVFPPQTFLSTGLIIAKSECTICRQEYEDCPHVKGRPYMGEFCCEEVVDIDEFREVSVVGDPASKRCRVTTYGQIDMMTLTPVNELEEEDDRI